MCFWCPACCPVQSAAVEITTWARKQRALVQAQTEERHNEVTPSGLVGVHVLPERPNLITSVKIMRMIKLANSIGEPSSMFFQTLVTAVSPRLQRSRRATPRNPRCMFSSLWSSTPSKQSAKKTEHQPQCWLKGANSSPVVRLRQHCAVVQLVPEGRSVCWSPIPTHTQTKQPTATGGIMGAPRTTGAAHCKTPMGAPHRRR